MRKKTAKTHYGKYAVSTRLSEDQKIKAEDFADRCGRGLSLSGLLTSSLNITLELLNNPKKLEACAPHSGELARIAQIRDDNAENYEKRKSNTAPIGIKFEDPLLMEVIQTLAKNDPEASKVLAKYKKAKKMAKIPKKKTKAKREPVLA